MLYMELVVAKKSAPPLWGRFKKSNQKLLLPSLGGGLIHHPIPISKSIVI
jgi:hypothetical protein